MAFSNDGRFISRSLKHFRECGLTTVKGDPVVDLPVNVRVLTSQNYRSGRRTDRIRNQAPVKANSLIRNAIDVWRRHDFR
ncbi:MAG: hypothetical protein MK240_06515 [Opitutales bacterium]|nr:hypothetical protein [Opitutales bacterium]